MVYYGGGIGCCGDVGASASASDPNNSKPSFLPFLGSFCLLSEKKTNLIKKEIS